MQNEPVVTGAMITTVLLAFFAVVASIADWQGIEIPVPVRESIRTFTEAAVVLAVAVWARSKVTPVS